MDQAVKAQGTKTQSLQLGLFYPIEVSTKQIIYGNLTYKVIEPLKHVNNPQFFWKTQLMKQEDTLTKYRGLCMQ